MTSSSSLYTVALVPAKLTSQRIPKKNLAQIAGQALYIYSVKAGLITPGINETYVSSESPELLDEAKELGAQPILRPDALSDPTVRNQHVIEHAMGHIEALRGRCPDLVVLLQPTHPFRCPEDISKGLQIMKDDPDADSLFSLRPIDPAVGVVTEGYFQRDAENLSVAAQRYINTGSFYIIRPSRTLAKGSLFGKKIKGLALSRPDMEIDIDQPEQLAMARGLSEILSEELVSIGLLREKA